MALTMERRILQARSPGARTKTTDVGVRFHDLHHSTASGLINSGVDAGMDPHTIGKVLGHRDTRSTDRYSRMLMSTPAAAINKIGRQTAPHNDSAPSKEKTA